jgi:cellulose synthase/poly-beta-1,6-N-acetylglucosamine synthase-like glycosyltransferase
LEGAFRFSRGKYIAVFDADFRPNPDFLKKTIPHFLQDDKLGMVQSRWGHLNPSDSYLTAAQTIALDKHFVMEQTVRHRANFYPKFNGSAGVWRKECIADAGGWQADTVCEDLCLSTRAILKGWKFLFLNDVVSPAELPTTISAYKNQQARWAKGSTQCLVKFAPAIIADDNNSRLARIYALLSMAGYSTHMLMLLLLLVQIPLVYLGFRPPAWFILFGVIGLAQPVMFVLAQREIYLDWRKRLRHFPALILIAIGLAAANVRAILQAVIGRKHVFVRTPKRGDPLSKKGSANDSSDQFYRLPADWIVIGEMFLALYALAGLLLCILTGNLGPLFFMVACTLGFGYVSVISLREQLY